MEHHEDVEPTLLEIADAEKIRKAAIIERNRRKRLNNRTNKKTNKEQLAKPDITSTQKVKM